MRAAIMSRVGSPDEAFDIREVERPTPIATEVLVRVRAIGTNPVEAAVRSGALPLLSPPTILGWDLSGVVEEVVPGVTRFKVGDEVFGMPWFPRAAHTYAEYVAAPSRQLARKPASLDHVHAAALPLVGLTAWQSLVDTAGVTPGQRVLIHGAGGGVGHVAVQIAKALGAEVVATASSEKVELVRALGADQVIDYRGTDFTKVAGDMDVVFDLVGKDYGDRSVEVLRPGGLFVTAVQRRDRALSARVEAADRRFAGISVEPDHVGLEALGRLADQGRLKVHVSHTLPLERVADAHRLLESGQSVGKIVLTP